MPGMSPFREDWLACMRAHYTHVIRTSDTVTEKTLRGVLQTLGFSETELTQMYVEASMHVDQVGADFVPDPEMIDSLVQQAAEMIVSPPEAITQETLEVLAEVALEIDAEVFRSEDIDEDTHDGSSDLPQQMSLF